MVLFPKQDLSVFSYLCFTSVSTLYLKGKKCLFFFVVFFAMFFCENDDAIVGHVITKVHYGMRYIYPPNLDNVCYLLSKKEKFMETC